MPADRMSALACRRQRLLRAARRLERTSADDNPVWAKLARRHAEKLRKEAASIG